MIGKVFNNRYEIKEKLGAGGTALVYMGRDTLLGRLVTIKILREEYAQDPQFVARFRHEAQAVASLSHNNIVSVYDVGYEDTYHYIVMEYVEGPNLKEYIKEKGPLPIEQAVDVTVQILNALEHAHNHGVIHRDIKSHNILFGKEGVVKVTDFGIAMAISDMGQNYLDRSGNVVGSVQYMSPEQVQGLPVSEKSDIYSTGVVLYEMLTGKLPYTGKTPVDVAMQHVKGEALPPHRMNREVPMELSFIVQRAMRKSPDIRYASAAEMRASLLKLGLDAPHNKTGEEKSIAERNSHGRNNTRNRGRNSRGNPKNIIDYRVKWIIIALVIILIFTGIYSMFTIFRALARGEEVTVPNVLGSTKEVAIAELDKNNLGYTLDWRSDNQAAKDTVISQNIAGGQVVKKDRVVGLVLSSGPDPLVVPNITGLLKREAEVTLNNNMFTGSFSEVYDDEVPAGRVISQNPVGNTEVLDKVIVSVLVSKGPEEDLSITVPDLRGKELTKAREEIKEIGLLEGELKKEDSNDYYAGVVIAQSLEANSESTKGSQIVLTVSNGPGPSAKTALVSYTIPNDGNTHTLRIVVDDNTGSHEEYNQQMATGSKFSEYVNFYGTGEITVYVDGNVVSVQPVS